MFIGDVRSLLGLAQSGLRLVKREFSRRLVLGASKWVADPPRSDGRHERLLCCSPIVYDVGDSIKSLDTEYYAITARGKGIDHMDV